MENYLLTSSSSSTHPYQYLNFLNKLYSYYEQDSQKQLQRNPKLKLKTKSFKKMKIPDALHRNYMQQQSMYNTANKKKANQENRDITSGIWKGHAESLRRYRKQVNQRRATINHEIDVPEQNRICAQDSKNIFLKKLIKAGKIPSYNRQDLEFQVLTNIRTLSSENKFRTVTSRNIRTAHSANRPKSRVLIRHPMTAKPENREPINRSRPIQFQDQIKSALGNKTHNSVDIWDCMNLEKDAEELRYFDGSMSYKNVRNVQSFIDRVHEIQNSIEDY